MLYLLEKLPVELVGYNVLGYLFLKDIVLLERACGSKKSQNLFLCVMPYCPPAKLPSSKYTIALAWFGKKQCKISSLTVVLPWIHPGLHLEDLRVDSIHLDIDSGATVECFRYWVNCNVGSKVRSVWCFGHLNKDVMEQHSACTENVKQLILADNCMDWITADILSRWKLKEIELHGHNLTTHFVLLIMQTCTELTSITLDSSTVDDAVVMAVSQHCPKLETLQLEENNITWTSLLALSERGLPLDELYLSSIPIIPTADIARRYSPVFVTYIQAASIGFAQSLI